MSDKKYSEGKTMISGYDYYGNSIPVCGKHQRKRHSLGRYIRTGMCFTIMFISLVILGVNSVILIQTHDDMKKMEEEFIELLKLVGETQTMLKLELKPKIDLVTTFLSVKLPRSILSAFKHSNNQLVESLGGITGDLEKLIELYRSLLGFNDDWLLTPTTQHMTCTMIDGYSYTEIYEKVNAVRNKYTEDSSTPIEENPVTEKARRDLPSNPAPNIAVHNNESDYQMGNLFKTLSAFFNYNSTRYTMQDALDNLSKMMLNRNKLSNQVSGTPQPQLSSDETIVPHSDGHHQSSRKRRFAAEYYKKDEAISYIDDLASDSVIRIHTVDDTVEDFCSLTKQVLKFSGTSCPTQQKILEYIKCLTN